LANRQVNAQRFPEIVIVLLKTSEERRAYNRKYAQAHAEQLKAYWHTYHEKNRERISARNRKYRQEHGEELRAHARERYAKNKEQMRARNRKYYQEHRRELRLKKNAYVAERRLENPEEVRRREREYYAKHRAQYLQTREKRRQEKILKLNEYKATLKCSMCGQSFPNHPAVMEFHHTGKDPKSETIGVIMRENPSSKRLQTELAKCIPLCANCHRRLHYGKVLRDGKRIRNLN